MKMVTQKTVTVTIEQLNLMNNKQEISNGY